MRICCYKLLPILVLCNVFLNKTTTYLTLEAGSDGRKFVLKLISMGKLLLSPCMDDSMGGFLSLGASLSPLLKAAFVSSSSTCSSNLRLGVSESSASDIVGFFYSGVPVKIRVEKQFASANTCRTKTVFVLEAFVCLHYTCESALQSSRW